MTDLAERFYAKVDFDHPTRCWEWTAYRDERGYGRIGVARSNRHAHRVSWELWHGKPVPVGGVVMHECDNPPCVNPYHLTVGTYKTNMQDAGCKGRLSQPGDCNPNAKISDEVAAEVRVRALAGESPRLLAAEYGVSRQLISYIKVGHRRTAVK